MPVVTRNSFGGGEAYYLASDPDEAFLNRFYGEIARQARHNAPLNAPEGVEIAVRQKNGARSSSSSITRQKRSRSRWKESAICNLLNGRNGRAGVTLGGYDVAILAE